MAATPTPQGSLRQRNVAGSTKKNKDKDATASDTEIDKLVKENAAAKAPAGSERDHQVVFTFFTALAFLTRFWGISHPNEVVFDEVHFGKVRLRVPREQDGSNTSPLAPYP